MAKRNRSRSGADTECPYCHRKLRGQKGLKSHLAEVHADKADDVFNPHGSGPVPIEPREDAETCIACAVPFKAGDKVYSDVNGGCLHAACCGPERESYVGADGEPLREGEPIPEPWTWEG